MGAVHGPAAAIDRDRERRSGFYAGLVRTLGYLVAHGSSNPQGKLAVSILYQITNYGLGRGNTQTTSSVSTKCCRYAS